jgi:hypothetical protein
MEALSQQPFGIHVRNSRYASATLGAQDTGVLDHATQTGYLTCDEGQGLDVLSFLDGSTWLVQDSHHQIGRSYIATTWTLGVTDDIRCTGSGSGTSLEEARRQSQVSYAGVGAM